MINNNWIFGGNCGLDFSSSPLAPIPIPSEDILLSTREGCASISDDSGNLLFYTDGSTIWDGRRDSTNSPITGLFGNTSSTQSAIIVPNPNNASSYYIFTTEGLANPGNQQHFNGGLLDLSTWSYTNPLSNIIVGSLPNTANLVPTEKLTAIQHENCRDYWVITLLQDSQSDNRENGILRIFLVDISGVQFINDYDLGARIHNIGYIKSNHIGTKMAMSNYRFSDIHVIDFDKSTGIPDVANLQTLTPSSNVISYGIEFSPNNNILYYTNLDSNNPALFQVDLGNTILSSNEVTPIISIESQIGGLQLGRDNRIYVANVGQNFVGAIQSPDIIGADCMFNPDFITLSPGARCENGFPNLLANKCSEECNCGCTGCNKEAELQNEELKERAQEKFNIEKSVSTCDDPFLGDCQNNAINTQLDLSPCFYFHWGNGVNDQIEEHDTEIFYLTICNNFNDIQFNGLRITKVTLVPDIHPIDKIRIIPDRFISLDCLKACSCQTREFAMITRANDIAGNYTLEVEYCYDGIEIISSGNSGKVEFPVTIIED